MRDHMLSVVLAFCVLATPDALAEGEQADIENAKTPTDLLTLLPEKEADWPEPFWLIYEDEEGEKSLTYLGWSIERRGEDIVMNFFHGKPDSHSTSTLVYDPKGALKMVELREISPGDTHISTGFVDGDDLVFQNVTILSRPGEEPRKLYGEERTASLKDLFRAIPMHWLPVVIGYHARRDNLGYTFSLHIFAHDSEEVFQIKAEDIGGEQAEIGGKQRKARLLRIEAGDQDGQVPDNGKLRITGTFLKNGGCVGVLFSSGQLMAKARHASREEVDKAFKRPVEDGVVPDETRSE